MDAPETKSLPENAYLPLQPGETYQPVVSPDLSPPESTWRAVAWGLFLCLIFTVASAYSGLKVGQVMDASVPISILAIGLARVYAPALAPARERDRDQHRRHLGRHGGRRDLHHPGASTPCGSIPIRCRPP